MNTVLIYKSKHGTVEKCVSLLSQILTGKVDLYDLKTGAGPDLSEYGKVIIGGSIYAGRIQKEVTSFCLQNLDELKTKKPGLFICCMFRDNAQLQLDGAFPKQLSDIAVARDDFGGELKFKAMGFAERALTRLVSKTIAKNYEGLSAADTSKDISMISYDNIRRFADLMENT